MNEAEAYKELSLNLLYVIEEIVDALKPIGLDLSSLPHYEEMINNARAVLGDSSND